MGDVFGAGCGPFRQFAHFVRHHRKSASLLARARRFDGRIQRQQVGLVGDLLDGIGNHADTLNGHAQFGDGFTRRLHRGRHLAGRRDAEFHVAAVFINDLLHRPGIVKRICRHIRHFGNGLAELLHGRGDLLDMILFGHCVACHAGHLGIHILDAFAHVVHRT